MFVMERREGVVSVFVWLIMVVHPLRFIYANMEGIFLNFFFLKCDISILHYLFGEIISIFSLLGFVV